MFTMSKVCHLIKISIIQKFCFMHFSQQHKANAQHRQCFWKYGGKKVARTISSVIVISALIRDVSQYIHIMSTKKRCREYIILQLLQFMVKKILKLRMVSRKQILRNHRHKNRCHRWWSFGSSSLCHPTNRAGRLILLPFY